MGNVRLSNRLKMEATLSSETSLIAYSVTTQKTSIDAREHQISFEQRRWDLTIETLGQFTPVTQEITFLCIVIVNFYRFCHSYSRVSRFPGSSQQADHQITSRWNMKQHSSYSRYKGARLLGESTASPICFTLHKMDFIIFLFSCTNRGINNITSRNKCC